MTCKYTGQSTSSDHGHSASQKIRGLRSPEGTYRVYKSQPWNSTLNEINRFTNSHFLEFHLFIDF
jgi:hypothetical protein